MGKKRKCKNHKNDIEIWTEEQYEEYIKGLHGLDYIAGYTESGIPYGLPVENDDEIYNIDIENNHNVFSEDFDAERC